MPRAIASNTSNTIHCMHIGNALLESIHLTYIVSIFINSMFALGNRIMACKQGKAETITWRKDVAN